MQFIETSFYHPSKQDHLELLWNSIVTMCVCVRVDG